jgi:phosphoserine phosphatase
MKIIVSDIEGTLTTGSSWKALRAYYKENISALTYNLFFLGWAPRYLLVKLGLIPRKWAIDRWMLGEIQLFKGLTQDEFRKLSQWVVDVEMWPKRRRSIISELENYSRDGVKIVVVSSAYQPIVDAFAVKLNAIGIGSQVIFQEGKITGVELPINSHEHKAEAIQKQFPGVEIVSSYGDTPSDIPMMALSRAPVAVHPVAALRQTAETRGWRIVDQRD